MNAAYNHNNQTVTVKFSFGWNGDISKIYDKAREYGISKGYFSEDPEDIPEADDLIDEQIDEIMENFTDGLSDLSDLFERSVHEIMLEAVLSFWSMNGEDFDHDIEDFEELQDYFDTLEGGEEEDW